MVGAGMPMPVTQSGSGGCGTPVVDAHKLNAENATFCMVSSTPSSLFLPFRFDRVTALDGVLVSDGNRGSSTISSCPLGEEDEDREGVSAFANESVGKL